MSLAECYETPSECGFGRGDSSGHCSTVVYTAYMKNKIYTIEELKDLNKTRDKRRNTLLKGKEIEILQKYVVDLKSVRNLAKEYNCSKSLVHKIIKKQL